jgi:hypothetical protein
MYILPKNPGITRDNRSVNFLRWFFSPRSKNDLKSWNALFMTAPFVFGLAILIPGAIHNADVGSRQQSTNGVVTAYEPSNHNSCSYTYTVQGNRFSGTSASPTATLMAPATVGEPVQVYFDPKNPATSSLEDFSAKSRAIGKLRSFLCLGSASW